MGKKHKRECISHYEAFRSLPPAPTDKYGICIPFEELDLPETILEGRSYNETNHHYAFTKSAMSSLAIYTTFRNLDAMQTQQPADVHDYYHHKYGQPELLKPIQALDEIIKQYAIGGLIRIGSSRSPEYKELTEGKIIQLKQEYNKINHLY
jgi:hypothetical protein